VARTSYPVEQVPSSDVSRLECQDDMQVSTLQRLVRALGGELEIIVHLPTGDIRLAHFKDVA
jgi:hypothetical protein